MQLSTKQLIILSPRYLTIKATSTRTVKQSMSSERLTSASQTKQSSGEMVKTITLSCEQQICMCQSLNRKPFFIFQGSSTTESAQGCMVACEVEANEATPLRRSCRPYSPQWDCFTNRRSHALTSRWCRHSTCCVRLPSRCLQVSVGKRR